MKTVKDLIEALQKLPPDTVIWESTYSSDQPIENFQNGPLLVYRKDSETRLYIDDGEAFHGEVDMLREGIFEK